MILATGSATASARLGDSPEALEQRYGAPVSTSIVSGFTRCQYLKASFTITIFFQNGVSVLETFACRGFSEQLATAVVDHMANRSVGEPDQTQENQIRQAAGITYKDEVFWSWPAPNSQVIAAFNPLECVLAFFSEPATYANIQQALVSAPLAGS